MKVTYTLSEAEVKQAIAAYAAEKAGLVSVPETDVNYVFGPIDVCYEV